MSHSEIFRSAIGLLKNGDVIVIITDTSTNELRKYDGSLLWPPKLPCPIMGYVNLALLGLREVMIDI